MWKKSPSHSPSSNLPSTAGAFGARATSTGPRRGCGSRGGFHSNGASRPFETTLPRQSEMPSSQAVSSLPPQKMRLPANVQPTLRSNETTMSPPSLTRVLFRTTIPADMWLWIGTGIPSA